MICKNELWLPVVPLLESVCTAFSSPIGGILFALEEGASYWAPSLTWKTFWSSMVALVTLYCLNTVGSAFGKVGFNKLFSFGSFVFEEESSFAVFELALFVIIGVMGGIIGAIFNNTNERITKWRLKQVNHSKQ
jgi:H+/Cl- antiporter ClcA